MTDTPIPVIFIHGLWLHSLSWTEWAGMFQAAGYRAMAPGWPGVPRRIRRPVRAMDHPGARAPPVRGSRGQLLPALPAKVNTTIDNRGPLLLIMGGQDHTVPEAITKATLKQYRQSHTVNDLIEFPDRGHSLTIDHGCRDVASACLDWLYKNSL